MSLSEVEKAVREWHEGDELAQSPGFCRRSVLAMQRVAQEANRTEPRAQIAVVVWPEATTSQAVHYALQASDGKKEIIFNPVPAAQFPQYNGPLKEAPGRLQQMRRTPIVV